MKFNFKIINKICIFIIYINNVCCSDITRSVFGQTDTNSFIPAAFGDFDSNELTDVFMIKNEGRCIQIFLAYDIEPLLRQGPKCNYSNLLITSIVPGDFDGDAIMDVLVTSRNDHGSIDIYINWGKPDNITCATESDPIIKNLKSEPVTLDYNSDMIIDLFAETDNDERIFYIFGSKREKPKEILMNTEIIGKHHLKEHANAYLDLNNDFEADLFLITDDYFEIWNGTTNKGFLFHKKISKPFKNQTIYFGQSLFLDIDLKGEMNHIIPICFDYKCQNSSIFVRSGESFHDLHVEFKDNDVVQWGFAERDERDVYLKEITLRGGDFNMDGYPDLLVTLQQKSSGDIIQTFLLENIPSDKKFGDLKRTFEVKWKALLPFSRGTVMGAFYDFYQDGILDVILVERTGTRKYRTLAFRNTLDYDANFVKVIVLTGLTNTTYPSKLTPLGRRKKTYGTNLPGPRIEYFTTTQEGYEQHGASAQLSQSAYFSLQLPYTIFGLGRTPNFVDTLTVGLATQSHNWTQIIPNSQMVVIPWPINQPKLWKARLFVTPSKLILMSVFALGATCIVIMFIILGLYIKEKREDKIEKLAEAHRFHFDAM